MTLFEHDARPPPGPDPRLPGEPPLDELVVLALGGLVTLARQLPGELGLALG